MDEHTSIAFSLRPAVSDFFPERWTSFLRKIGSSEECAHFVYEKIQKTPCSGKILQIIASTIIALKPERLLDLRRFGLMKLELVRIELRQLHTQYDHFPIHIPELRFEECDLPKDLEAIFSPVSVEVLSLKNCAWEGSFFLWQCYHLQTLALESMNCPRVPLISDSLKCVTITNSRIAQVIVPSSDHNIMGLLRDLPALRTVSVSRDGLYVIIALENPTIPMPVPFPNFPSRNAEEDNKDPYDEEVYVGR